MKWVLAGLFALLLTGLIAVTLLVFPGPFLPHRQQFGTLSIRSDRPLPADISGVVEEVRNRVAAMEYPLPDLPYRVFICEDERLYRVLSFIVRRPSSTQAFVLSIPDNIYLNSTHIRREARTGPGEPRHWRFQGSLTDAISHELAHLSFEGGPEMPAAGQLPAWKAEGYADYQAHRAPMLADTACSLAARIGMLLDEDRWTGTAHQRRFFRWQLMAEYLAGVRGLGLQGIAEETVTEPAVYAEMIQWSHLSRGAPSGNRSD